MTEVWGLLAKAQDDAQTIDEAILAAITAHEADSDAHLGSGESLESHKDEAVIDHLAGSVLADKLNMTQYTARTIFEALDKWDITGTVSNEKWPGIRLWSDYSPTNVAEALSKDSIVPDYLDYDFYILFQCLAKITETINKTVYFGYGYYDSGQINSGFGFKVVNGTLYGYWEEGSISETVELTSVNLYTTHCYRAQWDPDTETMSFYVDGVLKGTIEESTPAGTGDGDITFRIEATATGECYLYIYELYTARDIL